MFINNNDLEFLVSLEDLLYKYEGNGSENLNKLLNLNERLIAQRDNSRKKSCEYAKRVRATPEGRKRHNESSKKSARKKREAQR